MTRFLLLCLIALAGCQQIADRFQGATPRPGTRVATPAPVDRPAPPAAVAAIVSAPPPPATARTAATLDTVTDAQKEAATATATGGTALGQTVASLGDPTEAGLWIRTPLAQTPGSGRVETAAGQTATVQIIPTDGPATGGSQLSLSAMRLLGLGLTDLPTVTVYVD